MNEARPYASLSSGLLARKGAAKPAMRPQGIGGFEDLGWNDMGHHEIYETPLQEHVPSSIAALTPAPKLRGDEPSVVAQQRAIAESFADGQMEAEVAAEAEETVEEAVEARAPAAPTRAGKGKVLALPPRPAAVAAVAGGKKAAFTLRLDSDRHLRLRLATAVTGRSAQLIVTKALDDFLATFPEIDALADRLPASGAKRS